MSPELREAIDAQLPDAYYPIPARIYETERELTDPLDEEVSFTLRQGEAFERVFFIGEIGVDWARYLVHDRVRLVPEVCPSFRQSVGMDQALRKRLDKKLLRALGLKAYDLSLPETVVALALPGEYGERDATLFCFREEARGMLQEFERKNARLRKRLGV